MQHDPMSQAKGTWGASNELLLPAYRSKGMSTHHQSGPAGIESRTGSSSAAGWSREFAQVSPQPVTTGTHPHPQSAQLTPADYAPYSYSSNQYPQGFNQQPYWMPSVSEPHFHPDGRLRQNPAAAGSGLDTIQQGWNEVFDQIEREFTNTSGPSADQQNKAGETQDFAAPFVDVPRNLDEALSQARTNVDEHERNTSSETKFDTSVQGANMGWEEEIPESMDQQEEQQPVEEEDDFDQAGFAAFYGRQWQPGGTAEDQLRAQQSAAQAAELQRSMHGISSEDAESLLTRGEEELAHEQLDTARRLGYMVNQPKALRREEVGRYLFNKANPYIGLSPEQKARLMTDRQQGMQYQVSVRGVFECSID